MIQKLFNCTLSTIKQQLEYQRPLLQKLQSTKNHFVYALVFFLFVGKRYAVV